ncbi:AcrR family transcriptional regulator [Pedobacter sp. CG_S7]|uniref:TetR/AcrR family transcriptional regulator n=1 Tax=Pedobacter sp. CG_S7 TaxID=3143930 RepID=UPI00339B6C0C
MEWQLHPKMNKKLYLKDPEGSEIGKKILTHSVSLIKSLGFELFTFRKLAEDIGKTEATVYRYFENKHRLLNYIVAWYWHWLDYQLMFNTNNILDNRLKINIITNILTWQFEEKHAADYLFNMDDLHIIIMAESSKVYLTKNVFADNEDQLFKPYKNFCANIANVFIAYNPDYIYSRSLASTIVEMANFQDFFMTNLPSLTDFSETKSLKNVRDFLNSLIFSSLDAK